MHNNKKKTKVQPDPEMREIRWLVSLTLIAFFISAAIVANPDINIIIDFFLLPEAFADHDNPVFPFLLERGQNYSHVLVGVDGNHDMIINATFDLPNYIVNDVGVYVPYILTENDTTYKIESERGSMIFHKTGCNAMFYNAGYVNATIDESLLNSESWVIHQRNITDMSDWEYITDVNDASCTNTIYEDSSNGQIILESNKTSASIATSSVKYILHDDIDAFKVLTQVTNENPDWTNNTMGFIQTIDVPDDITINGTNWNIPSNNGTFFDHDDFNNTISEIILGPISHYYTDSGLVNLWGATLWNIDNQSKIVFDYSFNDEATALGETYEIDPTFAFTSGTRARLDVANTLSDPCPNVSAAVSSPPSSNIMPRRTDGAGGCSRSDVEFDTSSIPAGSIVTDVNTRISFTGTGVKSCDIWSIENQPSTRTATQRFADAKDGTEYVNGWDCKEAVPTVLTFDLGATADADLESHLTWFGVGIPHDSETFPAFDHQSIITNVELEVQYTQTIFTVQLNNAFRAHTISTASCTVVDSVKASDAIEVLSSTSSLACIRSAVEWNVASIPDGATILDVDIEYDVISDISTRACDYNAQIASQPSTTANPAFYNNIGSGTTYVNANTDCQLAVANNYQADLGATAVTDLQNQLALDWFGVGVKMDSEALTGIHFTDFGTDFDLIVQYQFLVDETIPPAQANFVASQNEPNQITLAWQATNASSVTNHDVFVSDNADGPYTLLDTIGNVTTFTHMSLGDNVEKHYKLSAWFNPNGTNATAFGVTASEFAGDTSLGALQQLHSLGEQISVQHDGIDANCPVITGPSSATDNSPQTNIVRHNDPTLTNGCWFTTWSYDDTVNNSNLFPIGLNETIIDIKYINDIDVESDSNTIRECDLYGVSSQGHDPRNNVTGAYDVIQRRVSDFTPTQFTVCNTNLAQVPQERTSDKQDWYDSILLNNTFYSFGINTDADDRTVGQSKRVRNFDMFQVMEFNNPTLSGAWQIQEHSKFPNINLQTAVGQDLGGKFNLDTDANGGQIVIFKEFNKTQVGTNPIQVAGDLLVTGTDTNDVWLRFEVKDGTYGMQNETAFPKNQYEIYQGGGSLGAIHIEPKTLDVVQSFNVTMLPNYNNSTQDMFTVFIGLDDNSSANTISANLTNFEIDTILNHNFTAFDYIKFWETTATGLGPVSFPALTNNFDAGIVNATRSALNGVASTTLPTPTPVTNLRLELNNYDTFKITWHHDLLNSTGFRIESNTNGGGWETLAVLSNPFKQSFIDANQPSKAERDISSTRDALGYPESTTKEFRIIVLNGESESTTVTTSNTKTTKADYSPYWELIEHNSATGSGVDFLPDVDFTLTGGDTNDWLSMQDKVASLHGDRSQFIYKSFNKTEHNITNFTDFMAHLEFQCNGGAGLCPLRNEFMLFDGGWNRYNTSMFNDVNESIITAGVVSGNPRVAQWGAGGLFGMMGALQDFDDRTIRLSGNTDQVSFDDPTFITAMLMFDTGNTIGEFAEFDIKNFTVSNSTTWDFTTGPINYTRNAANAQITNNCQVDPDGPNNPFILSNQIDSCDRGSVFTTQTSHQELITVQNVTSDWQYREAKDDVNDAGHSQVDFDVNATGVIITNSPTPFETSAHSWGVTNYFLFKTITPLTSTLTINATIEGIAVDNGQNNLRLTVYNGTMGNDSLNGRWDNGDFEEGTDRNTQMGSTGRGEELDSNTVLCTLGTGPTESCNIINAGETITGLVVGHEITVALESLDQAWSRDGQYRIENITVGGTTWDFNNAQIFKEVDNTTADRGIIRAGNVILQPSPEPDPITSVTATARIADVLIEWASTGANTTDYFIENGTFPINTADLKLDFTMDAINSADLELLNVGPASELTNSFACGTADCNYSIPSVMFGTTQVTWQFTGAGVNTDKAVRIGLDGNAGVAVNVTNISDWDFLNDEDWSITWWMFRDATNTGFSTLFTTINDGSDGSGTSGGTPTRDGFTIVLDDDNQQAQVFTMNDNSFTPFNETSPISFLDEDSTFHHYAITHDIGNELKWYRDGVLVETDSSIGTSTGFADIGPRIATCWANNQCIKNDNSTYTGGSIEFPSVLDQFLFFNRVIDSTEVSDIYGGGSGLAVEGTFTTLVPSVLAANGNITTTAYLDEDVERGISKQYRVTPTNLALGFGLTTGTGVLSNSVLTNDFPATPTGLTGSYIDENTISLDWDDLVLLGEGSPANPSLTLIGYKLFERDLGGGAFNAVGITTNVTFNANPTIYEYRTANINQASCPFPNGLNDIVIPPPTHDGEIRVSPSNNVLWCERNGIEWDLSSIPTGSVITSVNFVYDINFALVSTSPRTCDFKHMDHQPSAMTELQGWLDAGNGTTYFTTPAGVCETSSVNDHTFSSAQLTADIQTSVNNGDGWFAMGEKFTSEARSNGNIYRSELKDPELVITYISTILPSNFLDTQSFPQEKEYKVSGCNELGCNGNSTIAQVLAFPLTTPVLSASANVPLGINATWTMGNPAGIVQYSLFNSSDNITFDLLATTPNGTLFFFDTPHPVCFEQFYKVRAETPTQNGTNSTTALGTVNCVFTPAFTLPALIENIGDTFKVSGSGTFTGGNLTQIALLENGTQTDIDITDINFTTGPSEILNFNYLFWERDTVSGVRNFTVAVSGQSPLYVIDTFGSSGFATSEYNPKHKDAIVESQGQVNFTHFRFNGEDDISLKVNRIAVPSGETWQIECIYQDVNDAIATKDSVVPEEPTVDWVGTWDNTTDTGYFNSSFTGASGSHVYISCFNDLLLFSTTSYTNSSLALFGIDAFDTSFGSLIGIPSGIFMLVLMAGMANKRTSPTWIVVITGAAGVMSVVGFFSLDPIVWGLALVTAMLGMFVNQKVF